MPVDALAERTGELEVALVVELMLVQGEELRDKGEPESIWTFLGSERLGEPIAQHKPDLVLHGHGHRGSFAGRIEDVPVFNVGVPVIGRDFWIFELDSERGLIREPEGVQSA